MSTEIKTETRITVEFDVDTFKWHIRVHVTGVHTAYDCETIFEISSEGAKRILNDLNYNIFTSTRKVHFSIK